MLRLMSNLWYPRRPLCRRPVPSTRSKRSAVIATRRQVPCCRTGWLPPCTNRPRRVRLPWQAPSGAASWRRQQLRPGADRVRPSRWRRAPQVAHQILQLANTVLTNVCVGATRPTLVHPTVIVALGSPRLDWLSSSGRDRPGTGSPTGPAHRGWPPSSPRSRHPSASTRGAG